MGKELDNKQLIHEEDLKTVEQNNSEATREETKKEEVQEKKLREEDEKEEDKKEEDKKQNTKKEKINNKNKIKNNIIEKNEKLIETAKKEEETNKNIEKKLMVEGINEYNYTSEEEKNTYKFLKFLFELKNGRQNTDNESAINNLEYDKHKIFELFCESEDFENFLNKLRECQKDNNDHNLSEYFTKNDKEEGEEIFKILSENWDKIKNYDEFKNMFDSRDYKTAFAFKLIEDCNIKKKNSILNTTEFLKDYLEKNEIPFNFEKTIGKDIKEFNKYCKNYDKKYAKSNDESNEETIRSTVLMVLLFTCPIAMVIFKIIEKTFGENFKKKFEEGAKKIVKAFYSEGKKVINDSESKDLTKKEAINKQYTKFLKDVNKDTLTKFLGDKNIAKKIMNDNIKSGDMLELFNKIKLNNKEYIKNDEEKTLISSYNGNDLIKNVEIEQQNIANTKDNTNIPSDDKNSVIGKKIEQLSALEKELNGKIPDDKTLVHP